MINILSLGDDAEWREVEGWALSTLVITELLVSETDSLVLSHNGIDFEEFNGI